MTKKMTEEMKIGLINKNLRQLAIFLRKEIIMRGVCHRGCSLGRPPWYRSAAVLFDREHPRFRNFNSIIPIDVVRVKSYVNSLFNPTGVPMWVSVRKLTSTQSG